MYDQRLFLLDTEQASWSRLVDRRDSCTWLLLTDCSSKYALAAAASSSVLASSCVFSTTPSE